MGASNCPETPRQKMIQMMYLVYTAMLALNVSAAVVSSFVTVGDAMNMSNENIQAKLDDTYTRFEELLQNNREKTQEHYDKVIVLGDGVVTTAETNDDDPAILAITDGLRDIEKHIRRILRQANTDCEDYAALKNIIETITL